MPDDAMSIDPASARLPIIRSAPAMTFEAMLQLAQSIAKSGLFGMKTADQALALMAIAQAEGRHPALAARDYDIINGRPAKKAEAMMRDFLEGGGRVQWIKLNDTEAEATFSHPSGGTATIGWDMQRARAAGIGVKDNWKKFPRQMLRSRVVSEGVRTIYPMATSGMYVPEEVAEFAPAPIDITPRTEQTCPAGSKLDQFEQRHAPGVYDVETGEVEPDYSNDQAWLDAGDAVCERGEAELKAWWVSLDKTTRERMGGHKGKLLTGWKARARAADLRGGPEPEIDDYSRGGPEPETISSPVSQATPAASEAGDGGGRTVGSIPATGAHPHEIPPVLSAVGKPIWPTWTNALFLPKLAQIGDIETLTDFWQANAMHIEAARAALGDAWPEAECQAAWARVA